METQLVMPNIIWRDFLLLQKLAEEMFWRWSCYFDLNLWIKYLQNTVLSLPSCLTLIIPVIYFLICRRGPARRPYCEHSVWRADEYRQEVWDDVQQEEAQRGGEQTGGRENPGGVLRSPVRSSSSVCLCSPLNVHLFNVEILTQFFCFQHRRQPSSRHQVGVLPQQRSWRRRGDEGEAGCSVWTRLQTRLRGKQQGRVLNCKTLSPCSELNWY